MAKKIKAFLAGFLLLMLYGAAAQKNVSSHFPPVVFKVEDVDIQKNAMVLTPYLAPSFKGFWIDSINRIPAKNEVIHCRPAQWIEPKQGTTSQGQVAIIALDCKGLGVITLSEIAFVPEQ